MVALSSHDDESTRRDALAQGFDQYLTKPVNRATMTRLLLGLFGLTPAQRPPVPTRAIDEDLKALLPGFVASRRGLLAQLEQAGQTGQREEVRRLAHLLAGSLGLYGFGAGADICGHLERQAQTAGADEVRAAVQAVEADLNAVTDMT